MKKYILFLLSLWVSVGAWAENVITISATEGGPGEEVTVSISLENADAVSSLQVSIPLDESLTLVSGSGLLADRCGSHSLTVGVKDGVLNVFIYSISMAAISGNSGEVASFRLTLGSQPTTLALTPSKSVLAGADGETLDATAEGGSVTIRCAKAQYSTMEVDFGAVPIRDTYTQSVTVTNVGNDDLTITGLTFSDVNVFSSTTALPIVLAAGASQELNITYAPTERGSISKTLKVECNSVSKLNTIALLAQPFAVNELHVQPASGISDEEVTIRMTMNNMDAISGYQVEFTLPEQLEYVDGSFVQSDRKQDHQALVSLNGSVLRILVYSSTDKPLTGDDGEIGSLRVKLVGRYGTTLTPTKTVLTATINHVVENVVSDVTGGYIDIQSPQISGDDQLAFGAVAVTEDCEQAYTIYNYGSAPLTISRVVFNDENLSVSETLPMVIPAGESAQLTVVYSSVEQTAFEATMQLYCNDPDLRMKNVAVTGSRFAPNFISIATSDVLVGGKLRVDVSVDNYDAMTGLQFDLTYPGQFFETFDNNVTLTDRATGMTVTAIATDANTLRFFCYFLTNANVAAGSGKVMSILLKRKDNVPAGSYDIGLSNIKFGTSGMTDKYAGTDLDETFEVLETLLGDVNVDGQVDAQDASLVLQYVAKKTDTIQHADINNDGKIDAQDASLILQYVAKKITW